MIARLVRSGMPPAAAAKRVRILLKQCEPYLPTGWVLFVYDEKSGIETLTLKEPPNADMIDSLDRSESVYLLINAGRLVERVAAHFDPDDETETAAE